MELRAGIFLKSTDATSDDPFAGATIYLKEYNAQGAVGVIVNRPYGRTLNELEEFRNESPVPLYYGGPVDEEHLFFLHRRPDLVEGGDRVTEGVYWGGSFRQALAALRAGTLRNSDIRIFVGYCGWDAGDLEGELEEGSWEEGEGEELFG